MYYFIYILNYYAINDEYNFIDFNLMFFFRYLFIHLAFYIIYIYESPDILLIIIVQSLFLKDELLVNTIVCFIKYIYINLDIY